MAYLMANSQPNAVREEEEDDEEGGVLRSQRNSTERMESGCARSWLLLLLVLEGLVTLLPSGSSVLPEAVETRERWWMKREDGDRTCTNNCTNAPAGDTRNINNSVECVVEVGSVRTIRGDEKPDAKGAVKSQLQPLPFNRTAG